MKTICAFANDLDNWGGGYIVIGVEEENGRPVYPLMGVPTDKLDAYQNSSPKTMARDNKERIHYIRKASNAVYHRAYDVREPIEVRVEHDRIEIVSFPGPDRSVTQEGLKNYRVSNRRYRNRRIGDFLKELHLTEGRNTGFKKILNALEANGSPKPEFETDDDHSYFISRLFVHEEFLKEETKRSQKGAEKRS